MTNPTTIVVQQNADGSYDIPAITLVPYVAPTPPSPPPPPPPPPATDSEPAIGAPVGTQAEWDAMNPQGS